MITPTLRSCEPKLFNQSVTTRFERFMRWLGWINVDRHDSEVSFAVATAATGAEIDRLRSAQMEATQKLYEFVAARWNDDRTKWLSEDVAGRHQRDCNVIILAQAYMTAVDSSSATATELASLADRLRHALAEWKP